MSTEELSSVEFFKGLHQPAYEGASTNYRLGQTGLLIGDSDTLAAKELKFLQSRSQHAIRNNGWATAAFLEYRFNIGYVTVKWKTAQGKDNKKLQKLWDSFAANPCLDGYGTLQNVQDAWNAVTYMDGEVFTRMLIDKKNKKKGEVPLSLQNIESALLDPFYDDIQKNIKAGIEFEGTRPVKYWFDKNYSRKNIITPFPNLVERVDIAAEDILHIFRRDRAGQWRGIPQCASVLLTLYGLDDLEDATLNKQKAAQAVSWIIKNTNPTASFAIGVGHTVKDSSGKDKKITKVGSSGVHYLESGEDISFYEGSGIGNNLEPFLKYQLHKVAKSVGLSYETLTGDLGNISFSALKYVISEMRRKAELIYQLYIINLGLAPLCNRFKDLAALSGPSNFETSIPTYQFPRAIDIDGLKTAQQDVLEISAHLNTLDRVLGKRNLTMEEVEEDVKKREAAGLNTQDILAQANQAKNITPNSNSAGA